MRKKQLREAELADLQKTRTGFATNCTQASRSQRQELMKPLIDKAHAAIDCSS